MPTNERRSLSRRSTFFAAAFLLSTARFAGAQIMASERGKLTQVISGTEIEVEYYRPSVRGRSPVFGGIVTWGEVWTPGANYATTLRVSKEIELNGVAIPAGKYGLWIQVLEEAPWTLVVHGDTLRGHGNHPAVDEGLYRIPLEPTESPAFFETLTFVIDRVRATSAELQLNWGNVRVPMALGIDMGVNTALSIETAAALAGEWLYDDTPSLPSAERVEEWEAEAEARGEGRGQVVRRYFDGLFALKRPRPMRFDWNPRHGTVSVVDPERDEWLATEDSTYASQPATDDQEGGESWGLILIPRGEGIFMLGFALGGELAEFDPAWAPMMEFEFDDDGRAVRFTRRNGSEEVQGTGVRPSGAGVPPAP